MEKQELGFVMLDSISFRLARVEENDKELFELMIWQWTAPFGDAARKNHISIFTALTTQTLFKFLKDSIYSGLFPRERLPDLFGV